MPRFHNAVVDKGDFVHAFKDPTEGLLFKDFTMLRDGLSHAKITVCFPRCDTHPEMAGDIETLTQRYWECMLSRSVILGRSPKELIDFVGYDPVVQVDWNNPKKQLDAILKNINDYQCLVDKNFKAAIENAPWSNRMKIITSGIASVFGE